MNQCQAAFSAKEFGSRSYLRLRPDSLFVTPPTALLDAVEQGLISEVTIDQAVKRLFTARFRLGMFDPPEQVPYAQIPYEVNDSPEHQTLALRVARESIVLLKNESDFLPLKKEIASIAVIGPNANDLQVLFL